MGRARRQKLETARSPSYGTGEACRLTGAKASQLEYWTKSDLLRPDLPSAGRGDHRGFSFRNLVEISVAVLLAARGERDRSGWAAVDAIRIHDQEDWPENAPASLELVRMLHESIDHAAGLTDEEIRKRWGTVLLTGGLEDAAGYRRVATELRRLGHHVSPKELAAEDLRRTKAWRRFKNPRTRPPGAAYFLCSYRLIWSLVDSWEGVQFFVSRDRASHVINLRVVLEELERATGDHWRGWSEIEGADDDR